MSAPDDLDFNLESGYTAPSFNAVAFNFPYLPPSADNLNFDLESGYTPPLYNAVDFGTDPGEPVDPGQPGEHAGTISATTDDATGSATATATPPASIGTATATTEAATGTSQAIMEVFCLSGAVQDENGLPMERTVRAHRLNDGALIAETVSNSTGIFDINVGFEPAEFYVIALDTTPDGTDYLPPVTNRVTSVLRYD